MDQELSLVLLDSPKGAKHEQNLDVSVPSTHHRHRTFTKFFIYFSLVALAYYFIISSFAVSPISPTLPESASGNVSSAKCDLFTGDWIPDPSGPLYNNFSCHHIQDFQNCLLNGRPDVNYLFWRWKPRDCDLPRFSPSQFLDTVKNKWWAFIGDSISRNHVQSLICIISQVEEAVESNPKPLTAPISSFTSTSSITNGPIQYPNFDFVVISGGKWFLKTTIFHENNTITGCHYCQGRNNLTDLGYDYSYRKTLNLLRDFVHNSNHKPLVLFRTTTPDHFEHGEWNTGGYCNRTMPFKESEAKMKTVDDVMRDVELDVFHKFGKGFGLGSNVRLLDTTGMSLLRPDGHPGPYRHPNPFAGVKNKSTVQNDCLHWCLPGPIDSWNDVMMETMLNREQYI
ncbi:Protein trichome birefringence-like 26 [Cardamine amara subsp. amara]|uniref:Protein trichome birefringence-like 26 n=1 Tax=Cardamine amara subsp. amara TaxID=228776 RepID=A0ABD0ZU15_CARAN